MNNTLERYNALRALVKSNFSAHTQQMVDHALLFADEKLQGAVRYNSAPLLDHGVAVAHIVVEEIGLGRNSTIAAIIHDVVRIAIQENSPALNELLDTIRQEYGEETLGIAVALAKISENIKDQIYLLL